MYFDKIKKKKLHRNFTLVKAELDACLKVFHSTSCWIH